MSDGIREGLTLQGMSAGDREKYLKQHLEGYTVPGQNGRDVPVTGLEEQYVAQLVAVEQQRILVEKQKMRRDQVIGDGDLTEEAKTEFKGIVAASILQLALMEDKKDMLEDEIERIRERIRKISEAGTE